MKANRDVWDQWAAHHAREELGLYRIKEFKSGGSSLHALEIEELGPDVPGKSLLHLQCHFGLDTLSWLRHGASHVTGVDFSPRAIALARALAAEVGAFEAARVERCGRRDDLTGGCARGRDVGRGASSGCAAGVSGGRVWPVRTFDPRGQRLLAGSSQGTLQAGGWHR